MGAWARYFLLSFGDRFVFFGQDCNSVAEYAFSIYKSFVLLPGQLLNGYSEGHLK